eukprot:2114015-Prymnesium_polylepis.1
MYKCDAVARYVTVRRNVTHTHAATQSRTGTYRAHRRRRSAQAIGAGRTVILATAPRARPHARR